MISDLDQLKQKNYINDILFQYANVYWNFFNIRNKIQQSYEEVYFWENTESYTNNPTDEDFVWANNKHNQNIETLLKKGRTALKEIKSHVCAINKFNLKEKIRNDLKVLARGAEKVEYLDFLEEQIKNSIKNSQEDFRRACVEGVSLEGKRYRDIPIKLGLHKASYNGVFFNDQEKLDSDGLCSLYKSYYEKLSEFLGIVYDVRKENNIDKISTKQQLLIIFFLLKSNYLTFNEKTEEVDFNNQAKFLSFLLNRDLTNTYKALKGIYSEFEEYKAGKGECVYFTKDNLRVVKSILYFLKINIELF